jgi:hypothetical protein
VVVSKDILDMVSLIVVLSFEGYAWQTNQYGLAIDNIAAYELVKSDEGDGTIGC